MAEPLINRVYDLRIAGFDDSILKVEALTKAFNEMDAAKKRLNADLQQKLDAGDQTAVSELTKKIKDLEAEMAKLKTQRDSSAKEAALLAKAERDTAATLLLTEKATVAVATAEKIRFQTTALENKERQRQLEFEEKQKAALDREKQSVDALEGSYQLLKKRRQELEALTGKGNVTSTVTFENQTLTQDQAISQIKELKAQELEYTEKLKLEKTVHDDIAKSQQQEIISIQKQRTELETLITVARQSSNVSFGGQTFTQDDSLSKIQQLRSQEEQLTSQLNNEKSVRQSIVVIEESGLSAIKAQRQELEKLISESSKTSTISFKGQDFNFDEATAKLKILQTEEQNYVEKIRVEKTVHDQIVQSQEQSIVAIRKERTELESLTASASKNQISNVSFQNQNLSVDEAITKAHQLETAETQLTQKLLIQQTELKKLPQNYYNLVAAQKQALELYRITPSTSPFFEEVKQGAIKASKAVDDFNRTLRPDGTLIGEYKSGILNAFKELGLGDVLKKQRDEINQNLNKLKKESQDLAAEYRKTGTAGQESFEKVDHQLRLNLEQQEQMKKSLNSLDAALNNTGSIGGQISTGIANGFKNAKLQLSQLLLGYVGFSAVFSGLQSGIGIAKELSDQTSNLEVELGKAAGGAANLVDQLAKIDTRTKLVVLEQIANIAARAGVSEQNLVGVTKALDKIKIAFGNDFGNVEEGTESLVKLINIFEGADQVTGDNLLKVGNAVRTLANESVASVPFLNDFSQRMAGLKGIADISLPAVLGLASGFEQFGQSSEVAGTVLTKVIPKLATDTEKYAKVAGITQQAFSDLLKNNPAEALIKVSEGLTKAGGSLEEISAAFADSELGTGRIAAILGTVGVKADDFRKSIASAGQAYNETGNIEAAFAAKNENLAATLDKISKKFADAASSKAFQLSILAISSAITLIIGNIPALLILLGVLFIAWSAQTNALGLYNIQLVGYRLALMGINALQVIATVVNGLLTASLFVLQNAYAAVTKAAQFLNFTIRGTPVGLILGGLTLLITALLSTQKAFGEVVQGLNRFNAAAKINSEVVAEASRNTSDARAQAQLYVRVVKDMSISEEARVATLKKLIDIDPAFRKTLADGKIQYQLLNEALSQYNNSLRLSSELEASRIRVSLQSKKVTDLQGIKQEIQTAKLSKDLSDLSQEAKDFIALAAIKSVGTLGRIDVSNEGLLKQADAAVKLVDNQIDKQLQIVDAAQKVFIDKTKNVDNANKAADDARLQELKNRIAEFDKAIALLTKSGSKAELEAYIKFRDDLKAELDKSTNAPIKVVPIEIDIPLLESEIAQADEAIKKFTGSQKELNKLIADRKKLQAQLDDALNKENKTATGKTFRGSRLTGEQNDAFKDLDAIKDEQITQQKLLFKQLTIDEETYLRNILIINEDTANKKLALLKSKNIDINKLTVEEIKTIAESKTIDLSKLNAEERKQIAELSLFKIEQEEETNKQIFEIQKKRLDSNLESITKQSEIQLKTIKEDPSKSNTEKAKAEESFLTSQFIVQLIYNQKVNNLEKEFNQRSIENAQKRKDVLTSILSEEQKTQLNIFESTLKDIEIASQESINKIKQTAAERTTNVLEDNSTSTQSKAIQIKRIEIAETKKLLQEEVDADKKALAEKEKALKDNLTSEASVSDAKTKLKLAELALIKYVSDQELGYLDKLKQGLQNTLHNLTDFFKGVKKSRDGDEIKADLDAALQATSDIIKNAINNAKQAYFDNQARQIDNEKQLAQDRLSIQEEQLTNLAQSEAEKDSIRRQFDEKRKAYDKKAGEEKKQLALKEAAIDFGLAVIKTLATYPFPFSLIPVAGLTLAYLLQRASINQQQFAGGGFTGPGKERDNTGHRVAGVVHEEEWVSPKWMVKHPKYGPVIHDLEEIRKKGTTVVNQTTTHLTALEVFSSNRKGYASGGFAGIDDPARMWGDNLKAPFNPQAYLNPGSASAARNEEKMNKLMGMVADTNAAIRETSRQTNQRIDKLKVHVVTNEITDNQNKIKKASAIGTL